MSDTYFVRSQGKVLGPFSFEDLKTKVVKGHLKKTHQISTDRTTWQSARKVNGLFAPPPPSRQPMHAPQEPVQQPGEPELVEVELIEDSELEIVEPGDAVEWHYCLHGDEEPQGPVAEAKLRRLFNSGRLPMDALVWNENLGDWIEASRIPALTGGSSPQNRPATSPRQPIIDTDEHVPSYSSGELPVPPLASASLILGILGVPTVGVTSLFAIIFGHLGLQQIKADRQRFQGENMAKAGMILGYATLSIAVLGLSIWLIVRITKN